MCASNNLKPQNSPFQIWHSPYIFANSFSNFNPSLKLLLFFDSAKAGLLKIVQNHFLRCFRSQEISKTKVGTFFLNTLQSKRVSMVFQESFKKVSRGFQGQLKEVKNVCQGIFNGVSILFHGCFKGVSGLFQESFKGVSRKIEGCSNGVLSGFQRCLKEAQRVFEESYKGVSRRF